MRRYLEKKKILKKGKGFKEMSFEEKQEYVIRRLAEHGIKATKGKGKPKNGRYSGIVGKYRGKIKIDG